MQIIQKLKSTIFEGSTDSRVLSVFRILFGFWMFVDAIMYYRLEYVTKGLLAPHMHFKYDFLEWWPLFPPMVLQVLMALKLILPLAIMLGIRLRITALLFAIVEMYFLLLEKAYFNNHIYLYSLFALLLCLTAADDRYSLFSSKPKLRIPSWNIWHFRLLIAVAYFFTGVVKFKGDWLFRQEPIRSIVANFPEGHILHGVLDNPVGIYSMVWVGFLLDLLAPLWLLHKGIRNYMIWVFAAFHTMNSILFDDIGVFPFVMLSTIILFFDSEELFFFKRNIVASGKSKSKDKLNEISIAPASKMVITLSLIWFGFHILFPLRFLVLPNRVDFTTIGNRFSWRVKADNRILEEFAIYATNKDTNVKHPIYVNSYLNEMQVLHLWHDPRSLVQFARFMEEDLRKNHSMERVKITADIRFRYNGRESMYFIDPNADLTRVEASPFKKMDWVNQDFE